MVQSVICEWLMNNADVPIRYRVARELLCDNKTAKKLEPELLENPVVAQWLKNLKPKNPPQHRSMEHGSFDFCLENAMSKIVQLGLHFGMPCVKDASQYYIDKINQYPVEMPFRSIGGFKPGFENFGFNSILISNFLVLAGADDRIILKHMLGNLDIIFDFVSKKDYNIYISDEERNALKAVPEIWKDKKFIRRDLIEIRGYCYPLIYDLAGLHKLYSLKNPVVDKKINTIIKFISNDTFHETIADGYGILVSGNNKYHGMGWDPKFPGWFDVENYIINGNMPRLLYMAGLIAKYPIARKTKWFSDLTGCLEKYSAGEGFYLFPKDWLRESQGYAVMGNHVSFGENRRKKNWAEIESTFYMQLLRS